MLVRQSYREGGKIKHRTLANLSKLPPAAIEAVREILRGEQVGPLADSFQIVRSLPRLAGAASMHPSWSRSLALVRLSWPKSKSSAKTAGTRRDQADQSTTIDKFPLVRASEDCVAERLRVRQRIKKLMLRQGKRPP